MEIIAREIKPGMFIEKDGQFHEVKQTNFCDGVVEPLMVWGGGDRKTTAVLRIHLLDGRSILSHPSFKFLVAGEFKKIAAV
jgi:hypothetical protein